MLRSPLTTSVQVDRSPTKVSDGWVRETRTTKGIVGREGTRNREFQLWLYHRLFGDCVGMRA